jgi:hypothetical protein
MSPLRREPPPGGWIRQRTKVCGSRYCAVMAGGVNCAVRWQTWRCITNSFAVTPAKIQKKT